MADINVERKGPSVWPWIVGLIVLALLIWALVELFGDDDAMDQPPVVVDTAEVAQEQPATVLPPTEQNEQGLPAAVTTFSSTCAQPSSGAETEMGRQHQFTVNCLEQLSAALEALAQRDNLSGADIRQRLEQLRQNARTLQQSGPEASEHSNLVREAFISAAAATDALRRAQAGQATGNAEPALQTSAQAVQPDQPLLDQREEVNDFFRSVDAELRRIAERRSAV